MIPVGTGIFADASTLPFHAPDFSRIKGLNAVIICVPTPLNKNREPDISYILETGKAIAKHLQKGTLVVLESTTYPGTTDEDLLGVLEAGSGLKAGKDFHLAFSPEREDPGNPDSKVGIIPKVVGGFTPACLERARSLYAMVIKTVGFQMGAQNGLYAFTAAVLGGIGNIPGAVLGGLAIGLVRSLGSFYIGERWTSALVFLILIVILIFRPAGLLGTRTKEKV